MSKTTKRSDNDNYRSAIISKLKQIDLVLETEDDSVSDEWHFVLTAQQLALSFDDMEMLGIATKLNLKRHAIFDAVIEYDESDRSIEHGLYLKARQELIDREKMIQAAMEQCFFSNEQLMPIMDEFQRLVEANKQSLIDIGRYQELSNYVDAKASSIRFFRAVKAIIAKREHNTSGSLDLSEKTLISLFSNELPKFYDRAERHLATFIK